VDAQVDRALSGFRTRAGAWTRRSSRTSSGDAGYGAARWMAWTKRGQRATAVDMGEDDPGGSGAIRLPESWVTTRPGVHEAGQCDAGSVFGVTAIDDLDDSGINGFLLGSGAGWLKRGEEAAAQAYYAEVRSAVGGPRNPAPGGATR